MDLTEQEREYDAAWNDDGQAAPAAAAEDAPAGDPEQGVVEDVGAEVAGEQGAAPAADAGAVAQETETAAQAAAPAQQTMSPEDIAREVQRLKSWEGRLKAMEKQKAAPAAQEQPAGQEQEEASDALHEVAGAAKATGSEELAAAASAAAEAIESGDTSPEDAMRQLSEDFGEDFVESIKKIVAATAKQAVEPVMKDIAKERESISVERHFAAIAAKHPDYQEIGASPELKKYIDSLPADQKAQAERIAQQGAAEEVIGLLSAYKAAKQKIEASAEKQRPAKADTAAIDSAAESLEGVRSGGVRLPDKPPPADDDYAGAWERF